MSTDAKNSQAQIEKIVSLCKRRGFIYQSSEIYGGINGFWDYGPLGAELKRNLRDAWWKTMTREREDVVGLDATIIMHPAIWKASGHVDTFSDPMSTCKNCKNGNDQLMQPNDVEPIPSRRIIKKKRSNFLNNLIEKMKMCNLLNDHKKNV